VLIVVRVYFVIDFSPETFGYIFVVGRIILQYISKKQGVRARIGLKWLRIETSVEAF
jgi:hypothetical protein